MRVGISLGSRKVLRVKSGEWSICSSCRLFLPTRIAIFISLQTDDKASGKPGKALEKLGISRVLWYNEGKGSEGG